MILYHFTNLRALKNARRRAILKAGLKARAPDKDYPLFGGLLPPCVWFTSLPHLPAMMQTGFPQEVRITVELAPGERLLHWPTLLQHLPCFNEAGITRELGIERFERMEREKWLRYALLGKKPTDADRRAWRYWWVYFGDVPLKAIRAVESSDKTARASLGSIQDPKRRRRA